MNPYKLKEGKRVCIKPQARFAEFSTTSRCSAWCLLLPRLLAGGPMTLWLLMNCQVAVGAHGYPAAAVLEPMAKSRLAAFLLLCSYWLQMHMWAGRARVRKSLGKTLRELVLPEKHLLFGTARNQKLPGARS